MLNTIRRESEDQMFDTIVIIAAFVAVAWRLKILAARTVELQAGINSCLSLCDQTIGMIIEQKVEEITINRAIVVAKLEEMLEGNDVTRH